MRDTCMRVFAIVMMCGALLAMVMLPTYFLVNVW